MSLLDLVAGDLRIECHSAPDNESIELRWRGRSNDRQPGVVLNPYLSSVLSVAAQRNVSVDMHFEHIEHFNSSTITSIIKAIEEARRHRVPVRLYYGDSIKWQRLSFEALRVFTGDGLIEVRSVS